MTKKTERCTDEQALRICGFFEYDGLWFAPSAWGDQYGPWTSAKAAIKFMERQF